MYAYKLIQVQVYKRRINAHLRTNLSTYVQCAYNPYSIEYIQVYVHVCGNVEKEVDSDYFPVSLSLSLIPLPLHPYQVDFVRETNGRLTNLTIDNIVALRLYSLDTSHEIN